MNRPDFIKHINELIVEQSFFYPGETETFGIGAAMGRKLGLNRIGINYEILRPGDRSNWPHAHSHYEEFIFILEGNPGMWIDGSNYPLSPGDCMGLPTGTGHAHILINNTNKEVRAGENHPTNELKCHDGISDSKRSKK